MPVQTNPFAYSILLRVLQAEDAEPTGVIRKDSLSAEVVFSQQREF